MAYDGQTNPNVTNNAGNLLAEKRIGWISSSIMGDSNAEITRVLNQALHLEMAEQDAFVAESCAENERLRESVETLLGAYQEGSRQANDPQYKEQLWQVVYDELRALARRKMNQLPVGQTLQATALVHEAYLRLSESDNVLSKGRAYFFAAAAESMRRILVDEFRRKSRQKRGGGWERVNLDDLTVAEESDSDDVLFVDETLTKLEEQDPLCAQLVKLRFFAGMSNKQAALALGVSERTAVRNWTYARAWLAAELEGMIKE